MRGSVRAEPSVLDPAVLARLRLELDDDEGWIQFWNNSSLSFPPRRIEKLRRGLAAADYEVSMDAVLSLEISSQMVGANASELLLRLQRSLGFPAGPDEYLCVLPGRVQLLEEIAVVAELTALVYAAQVAKELEEPPAGVQCLSSCWLDAEGLLATAKHVDVVAELSDISRWNQNQLPASPSNLLKFSYDYGESRN